MAALVGFEPRPMTVCDTDFTTPLYHETTSFTVLHSKIQKLLIIFSVIIYLPRKLPEFDEENFRDQR